MKLSRLDSDRLHRWMNTLAMIIIALMAIKGQTVITDLSKDASEVRDQISLLKTTVQALNAQVSTLGGSPGSQQVVPTGDVRRVWISRIANAPGYDDPSGNVSGRVSLLDRENPNNYRIVLYARTDRLYIQPFLGDTHPIAADGTWQVPTRRGNAFVALLVSRDYQPQSPIAVLPPIDGRSVFAVSEQPAPQS